jgi:signal transduction histidine kinase/ActR/RegA family two-component response regulator
MLRIRAQIDDDFPVRRQAHGIALAVADASSRQVLRGKRVETIENDRAMRNHEFALEAAHRDLMSGRLPRFAACWLATTLAWSAVLIQEGKIGVVSAGAVMTMQTAGALAAVMLCRRATALARVRATLVTLGSGLGLSSTVLFAAARGSGDALAFVLLTLYLACALFFAWGWRPQMVVWLVTVLGWLVTVPLLEFRVPVVEFGTAIVIGSVLAFALAEGTARTFRLARLHRAAEQRTWRALEASRDAAEAAIRAKDQFLATLSHELRTPLTSILSWAQLLRRGTLDYERATHALEVIERNARHQARLIEDLLDVSRIAYGKLQLVLKPVDLRQSVRAVADTVRGTAEAKRVRVRLDLSADDVPLRADPSRLQQIVENLVSNAVKFTPEGGEVVVAVRRADPWAEVVVRDTGIGMTPEVLERVFERFHQADSSIARRHGGLGLGLAIARHLVELHGGSIGATSAGEGKGSIFTVRLPIDTQHIGAARAQVGGKQPTALHALTGLKVVVVDDERDARELFTTLLSECGAEVTPAASADEAMCRLRDEPADVLVADLAMPGEDGFALIRRVRSLEHERGTHMRAIAVTALASAEDRRRAMAAGFDLHLVKPVDAAAVVAAVAGAFGDATAC